MLSNHAQEFVTPLAFQSISKIQYIQILLKKKTRKKFNMWHWGWADVIIVAPATANTIAKLSVGIADDVITSTLLATETQTFIAPAMNVHMYENKRTQHNIETLKADGYQFIEPGDGYLACGYVAKGRMEEPLQIVSVINQYFHQQETTVESSFNGKHALVTAGPTIEVIDPVRFVSNRSSGKMGFAIANALKQGAHVTLITGPTQLADPEGIEVIHVESAEEMFQETAKRYDMQDIVVKAAAVSDYTPSEVLDHKMKKQDGDLTVKFKRTQDILKYLGEHKTNQYLVGFAAETQNIEKYAQDKLKRKMQM